jgi:hypothetical protein
MEMVRPWKTDPWKGEIVEGRARRRSGAVSQWVFQSEMGEGTARRQDVSVIPGRGRQKSREIEGEEVGLSSS